MRKQSLLVCLFLLCTSTPVFADTFFDFSFTGTVAYGIPSTPYSGSGVLDTTATATPGKYLVVGITGTTDGETITSILKKSTYDLNDNFIYVSGNTITFDSDGVAYLLANGVYANLYLSSGSQDGESLLDTSPTIIVDEYAPITVTPVTSTPEPDSLILLGTGALGLAAVIRRRMFV